VKEMSETSSPSGKPVERKKERFFRVVFECCPEEFSTKEHKWIKEKIDGVTDEIYRRVNQ